MLNDQATPTGGAELMTLALREGLQKRGHDARFFASSARPYMAESHADYHCFGTTSPFRTLLQTANPSAYWRLHQVLAEFQPDVVHVRIFLTQLSPTILPLLKDIPTLYHVAWYRPICPIGTKVLPNGAPCGEPYGMACYRNRCLPIRDWLPLMLQMRLWQQWRDVFDLTVVENQVLKSSLVAAGIQPVEVVWAGVPSQPMRSPLSSPPMVAFAGRLVREKGGDLLLRAFARVREQIPNVQLLIAGEGPERIRLNALIHELNLSTTVFCLGTCPVPRWKSVFAMLGFRQFRHAGPNRLAWLRQRQ